MDIDSDADIVRLHALMCTRFDAEDRVTLIDIGSRTTAVAFGAPDAAPAIVRIGVGFARIGDLRFHAEPPGALELENAISAVEDRLTPLARLLPPRSRLVAPGPLVAEIASAAGVTPRAGTVLALDAVEAVFQGLCALSEGRLPAASSRLPARKAFAAAVLIVREFMHHLGFDAVMLYPNPDR